MRIRELMTQPVITCHQNEPLNKAARSMWERDCGSVPVVDDDGGLVGMITDRDICMSAYTRNARLEDILIQNAMAKHVFSCRPDDTLDMAEQLMADKQIRRLPVVDQNNRPVGMLSMNDMARHAASTRRKNGVEKEVVETLAAICQPRHRRAPSPEQVGASV